jgi:hypothetical protein
MLTYVGIVVFGIVGLLLLVGIAVGSVSIMLAGGSARRYGR